MTITRTPIVDDDGSGETGTVLNNEWKQELYDQIDAAAAQTVTTQTTSYTLLPTDDLVVFTTAGVTLTLPAANSVERKTFAVRNAAASGVVTVDPAGAETIDAAATLTVNPSEAYIFKSDGSQWYTLARTVAGGGGGASAAEVTITLTGTQNDLSLGTSAANVLLRCNNASLLTITGIAALAGQRVTIVSVGAGQVELAHQNTGSSAANRLINIATSGNTPLAAGSGVASYVYDDTTDRWRLDQHTQGAAITRAFSAGDYTGNASMTVTVESGDVVTFRHVLNGRMLTVSWYIDGITIGGTPAGNIQITVPGGFTGAVLISGVHRYNNGGTLGFGRAFVNSSTIIALETSTQGAWSAGTNNTSLHGQLTFEVT